MTSQFDGQVVVITGAARGQGFETARLFHREGAVVVLTDLDRDEGQRAAERLGEPACFLHLDASSEEDWRRVHDEVEARWGRVDVLVNNAGVTCRGDMVDVRPEVFRRVVDVNLVGAFLGIHTLAPLMGRSGGGSIVNVSSVQGLLARAGAAAYTASKFGVRGLTKVAALELGRLGIRVNSIHPGGVATDFITEAAGFELTPEQLDSAHEHLPIPRCGRVEDIAPTTVFLASRAAAYITGAEIAIDGGMSAGIPALMR